MPGSRDHRRLPHIRHLLLLLAAMVCGVSCQEGHQGLYQRQPEEIHLYNNHHHHHSHHHQEPQQQRPEPPQPHLQPPPEHQQHQHQHHQQPQPQMAHQQPAPSLNQLAYYQYYSLHQYQADPHQQHQSEEHLFALTTTQELLATQQQHLNLNFEPFISPITLLSEQSHQQPQQSCHTQQQQQSVLLMHHHHHHHVSIMEQSTCSASQQQQSHSPQHTPQMSSGNVPKNLETHLALNNNNNNNNNHHHHHHHQSPAIHNSNVDYSITHYSSSHQFTTMVDQHQQQQHQQQQNFSMGAAAALRHYWREISALCLLSAICLNCLYLALKRRFFACVVAASSNNTNSSITSTSQPEEIAAQQSQTRSLSKDTNSSTAQDSAFEDPIPSLSLEGDHSSSSNRCLLLDKSDPLRLVHPSNNTIITRQRSSTLKAEPNGADCEGFSCNAPQLLSVSPTRATTCAIQTTHNHQHHNNSVSTSLSSSLTNTSEYMSRYSSDFHSIQRLGRGGFGIVFEARNKIDDCHYAVKRICLPLEKEARERVMREVRALAKLDHAGIVRYYNAWLETPPDEWLKQHDAKLGITQSKDGFASTDGIYDGQTTKDQHLLNSDIKASGDNSSDPFNGYSNNQWNSKPDSLLKYLKNNSSSPSLDIVFEGSGSISKSSDSSLSSESMNIHVRDKVEKVYLYIQMQLCRKDTLKDWLRTNCEHRDKTTIFDLFYQIVDAVEYVHSQDLIHRDLKPSNIFFSLDGTLKIGDFGLCRTKTSNGIGSSLDLQEYVAESDVERSFEAVHTEQVGTQLYMSPEQLNGLSYNQKVDIFAMGLILLELLIPFKTQMQRVNVLFKARNNLYSEEFQTEHPLEHELLKSLLSRSPLKRPSANEIKQHELLANAQLSQPVIERIYHRRRTISSNSSTE